MPPPPEDFIEGIFWRRNQQKIQINTDFPLRLFLAEKPSLARAIADVLPKPHQRGDGYIQCGDNDVVTWCIGHLLEQAEPDEYDERFKMWGMEHLPIVPTQWKLVPKKETLKQLQAVEKLVKKADILVNAGDLIEKGSCWWTKCLVISMSLLKNVIRSNAVWLVTSTRML